MTLDYGVLSISTENEHEVSVACSDGKLRLINLQTKSETTVSSTSEDIVLLHHSSTEKVINYPFNHCLF
jgi:hypothetical protein